MLAPLRFLPRRQRLFGPVSAKVGARCSHLCSTRRGRPDNTELCLHGQGGWHVPLAAFQHSAPPWPGCQQDLKSPPGPPCAAPHIRERLAGPTSLGAGFDPGPDWMGNRRRRSGRDDDRVGTFMGTAVAPAASTKPLYLRAAANIISAGPTALDSPHGEVRPKSPRPFAHERGSAEKALRSTEALRLL